MRKLAAQQDFVLFGRGSHAAEPRTGVARPAGSRLIAPPPKVAGRVPGEEQDAVSGIARVLLLGQRGYRPLRSVAGW